MQRYFASLLDKEHIKLESEDEHHLLHVMRMKKDDEIEVVANDKLFLCRIENVNPLNIYIVHEINSDVELNEDVTLLFALTKGDRTDLVVQKATELGVKKIALIQSERTVVRYEEKDIAKKCVRYQKIMKEASEQSHRLVVPTLLGIYNLKKLPKEVYSDLNYVAYEKDANDVEGSFKGLSKGKSVTILVGPEGGFCEGEVEYAKNCGYIPVGLGNRILRAETASIYALSVIANRLEDK